ncbi:hypothetical protein BD408DRAFT_201618 [Parasitella parasitica]|nr:hypothetical protein BD408DRAFT_201618 [Parasitella parasitica]
MKIKVTIVVAKPLSHWLENKKDRVRCRSLVFFLVGDNGLILFSLMATNDDLMLFTLPRVNGPETDLMSKYFLLNTDVMNIIVKEIISKFYAQTLL